MSASAAPLEKRALSRKDIHFYVNTLIIELTKTEFQDRLRAAAIVTPVPQDGEELLDRFETVQADFLSTVPLKVTADATAVDGAGTQGSNSNSDNRDEAAVAVAATATAPTVSVVYCDGAHVVAKTRAAAVKYTDPETERLIMRMCTAIEAQVNSISSTSPELGHIGEQMRKMALGGGGGGAHGHSHNGVACGHDHGHASPAQMMGFQGRDRAGGAMPTPTPEMERMMEMAMQTLSPQQKETLERVQATMVGGSPPSPADMQQMFLIQQHIMAFMNTMEQFMGGGGGGGSRGGRGGGGGRGRGGR